MGPSEHANTEFVWYSDPYSGKNILLDLILFQNCVAIQILTFCYPDSNRSLLPHFQNKWITKDVFMKDYVEVLQQTVDQMFNYTSSPDELWTKEIHEDWIGKN
jgi:hypothetical protein